MSEKETKRANDNFEVAEFFSGQLEAAHKTIEELKEDISYYKKVIRILIKYNND